MRKLLTWTLFSTLASVFPSAAVQAGPDCITRQLEQMSRRMDEVNARKAERDRLLADQSLASPRPAYTLALGRHAQWETARAHGKTPLPQDAEKVFALALPKPGSNGRTWFGWSDECGCYYRYQGNEEGGRIVVHWNGMTEPRNAAFRFPSPGGPIAPRDLPWRTDKYIKDGDVSDIIRRIGRLDQQIGSLRARLEREFNELAELERLER